MIVGSVDRVTAGVGVVFEQDDDLGVVDVVGGEDAVFVVGLEENDRGHEGASEVPGVFLGEGKIVLHVRAPSLERANPALDGSISVRFSGRDHRDRPKPSGRRLRADPLRVDRGSPRRTRNAISQKSGIGLRCR